MKIIHKPELKIIQFLDERYYLNKKTGNYQPSNTTYLSVYPKGFGFEQWLKDLGHNAKYVLERAQEDGTIIHEAIDEFNKGKELKWVEGEEDMFSLRQWLMLLKYKEFIKEFKPRIIASEVSMVSDILEFGTTLDLICEINKEVWYLDHKTGKGIFKTNKIQLAAGQKIWNEQNKEKVTRVGCLHLNALTRGPDKSGKKIQGKGWRVDEAEDVDRLWSLFEHTQAIWKEENPNPKPKNLVMPDRIKMEVRK